MQIQEIFLAALEIESLQQRAAYIAQACGHDQALYRKVNALLAAHERSGDFLEIPVLQQIAGGQSQERKTGQQKELQDEIALSFLQPSSKPEVLGRLLHYEVMEIIGRGGCGIVLKAFDGKLHRVVAIKTMLPELAVTSPARKRFLREARATAAIRHENVVNIYAVEEKPLPFLVMEYIDGQTLQDKIQATGPLAAHEVANIGQQIARGLAAAHARGVVHRDIKPANILLENGTGRPKITDFGLARSADDASLTQSGAVSGTPLYMSPEQAQGQELDQRSDLFSLGSVLYVMCSGRPPFRAATAIAVLKRVVEDLPRPLRDIIPEIPEWLVAIIAKLHAKNPQERFALAKDVAELLERGGPQASQNGRGAMMNHIVPALPPTTVEKQEPDQSEEANSRNQVFPSGQLGWAGRPRHRRWIMAAAMLLALLTGLGMTEATGVSNVRGTVLRLLSPAGTLVVEVDDPGISVSLDGEDVIIMGTGAKEIRLKPGQYRLLASKDGQIVRQELVTVTTNGRQVVRVSRESEPSGPHDKIQGDHQRVQFSDPDRNAAKYVLQMKGSVWLDGYNVKTNQGFTSIAALPGEPFRLGACNLVDRTDVTDTGMANFAGTMNLRKFEIRGVPLTEKGLVFLKGNKNLSYLSLSSCRVTSPMLEVFSDCRSLRVLWLMSAEMTDEELAPLEKYQTLTLLGLQYSPIGDAGLAHARNNKDLYQLDLTGTRVTNQGMSLLSAFKGLGALYLDYTQVGDEGLMHLSGSTSLEYLHMNGTQVTDNGLKHLAGLAHLKLLNLTKSSVTATGLEEVKHALPHCKITWDGGVIEPMKP